MASASFSTNCTAPNRPISSGHNKTFLPRHNPSLLPTPTVPSTTPYALSANKRKRENHRSNRRALYQELQELVLSKVHVQVRPEGQVHPFYDKIMLCLDPTLKENER
jgi:hypothetical protein